MNTRTLILATTLILIGGCATHETQTSSAPVTTPHAHGSVNFNGAQWQVADVVAMQEHDGVLLSLSDKPYNRSEFAIDGKLDSFDILRHNGHTLTLKIDHNGPTSCVDFTNPGSGGSKCSSEFATAIALSKNDAQQVVGVMHWGKADAEQIEVEFACPIENKLARNGTALPEDGGEPGKAVQAHFAAIASGDLAQIKAQTHPQQLTQKNAAHLAADDEMIGYLQQMSPKTIKVLGGVHNGDKAYVDYSGDNHGQKILGTAELSLFQGRWYVEKTHESHDDSNHKAH